MSASDSDSEVDIQIIAGKTPVHQIICRADYLVSPSLHQKMIMKVRLEIINSK